MTARANRTPTFFWQGTLILLPVVVMTVLGFTAIFKDRAAVEHEAQQRAREILRPLAPALAEHFALHLAEFDLAANRWAKLQRSRIEQFSSPTRRVPTRDSQDGFDPENWFGEWFPHWEAAFPGLRPGDALPNRLLFTRDGSLAAAGLGGSKYAPPKALASLWGSKYARPDLASSPPWPPAYDIPPRPPRWLLNLTPDQRAAWEALRQVPAPGANPADLSSAVKRFLDTDPPEEARANAEFVEVPYHPTNATPQALATALLDFGQAHPGAVGESGLPLAAVATAQALNLAPQVGHLWQALRDQVQRSPSMLTPALLEQARPLLAADTNASEGLSALTTQWAVEERLRDLGQALRESGGWPGLNSASRWLSARQDQWFCVLNPGRWVLDRYGQASPVATGEEVMDIRFYPRTVILACFAEARREFNVTLPGYLRLTADLDGEVLGPGEKQGADRVLAEAQELVKQPTALVTDPLGGSEAGASGYDPYSTPVNRIAQSPSPGAGNARVLSRPRVTTETARLLRGARVESGESRPFPVNAIGNTGFPTGELDSLPSRPRLTIRLSLSDPALLFAQQRERTLLYGGVITVSFLAALAGLVAARRAFFRQLRLNELKSNFVSSVSHELRAPIASVRLMAESLERGKIPEGPRQKDYFRFIGQECRRLSSLIENVLDFSRIEQGRKQYDFEPTDLVALVRQTVQLMRTYAAERQVEVTLVIPDAQIPILSTRPMVDGKALQQALVNLIDNAIKHSPKGANVAVGLETHPGASSVAASRESAADSTPTRPAAQTADPLLAPPSRICLWVEDHGEGIPVEEQDKIFERFYRRGSELRRETQGVGIGLSIVKHLVEAHGGRVLVRSAVGRGSRFTIELPLPDSTPPVKNP